MIIQKMCVGKLSVEKILFQVIYHPMDSGIKIAGLTSSFVLPSFSKFSRLLVNKCFVFVPIKIQQSADKSTGNKDYLCNHNGL